jgi:uncharacterized membrane protein
MQRAEADDPGPVFEALIVPYRSLSPRGVVVLVAVLCFLAALVIARFLLIGAWPVVAFSALEVPLVFVLLILNIRRARASEMILLDTGKVTVVRTDQRGLRSTVTLSSAWLRVDRDSDRTRSRLLLRSRDGALEIGAFLHDPDRDALYRALAEAIDQVRNPRFDNPQLREPSRTA